ncbi:MAG TPA: hypothetical protein VL588_00165 [Bdellovibrionota bacterium]|nr:hypothetical protein [Bdellovibrionota bacterium]
MMKPLHPRALPKKEGASADSYQDLLDLCETVIRQEGWDRRLVARREPGTSLVRILQVVAPGAAWQRDPEVVFLGSEDQFQVGQHTRSSVREACARFLRGLR